MRHTLATKIQKDPLAIRRLKSRSSTTAASRSQKSSAATFQLSDNRPEAIVQRQLQAIVNTKAWAKQLTSMQDNRSRDTHQKAANSNGSVVQKYDKKKFIRIKNIVDAYSNNKVLIENVDDPKGFNEKISTLRAYKGLNEEEKNMVTTQVKMKIRHDALTRIEPEDADDIKKNFNSLKSCVITALLYAEGGSVLGTSSVEGLHYILYSQFPKWRQYSDDAVLAQIYQTFGYKTAEVSTQARHTLVSTQDQSRGMTASTGDIGHMVGFKKAGESFKFRDNDHGESPMNEHATRNQQVNKIWWK